jgi:hypothetical protein
MPRKVFTAGEVLAAADVNEFLADQAIMTFADSTARGSAIPSPIEGMVTYLEDTNFYESYTGAAWQTLANQAGSGLVFLKKETFSGVASQSVNDVFSSTYQNYKIIISAIGSGNQDLRFRLRVGGSDATGNDYTYMLTLASGSAITTGTNTETSIRPLDLRATFRSQITMDVFHPFLATKTLFNSFGVRTVSALQHFLIPAEHGLSTSYTGFTFFPSSGTMTGEVQVYGYKES